MSTRNFTRDIDVLRQRLTTFDRYKRHSAAPQSPLIEEAVEELSAALEELQAANELLQQQNEELAAAHQRYRELFDFAPEAYLVTDIRGTIQEANDTAAALLRVRKDFLLGKPLKVFIAEEDSRAFLGHLTQIRQPGCVRQWEGRVQPREGPTFPAMISIAAAADAQGRVIGLRWLLRDISARKQEEELLRRAHDALERRVRERTAELAATNTALQTALRQKDVLLKEVHHRVKNNLQVVSSILSLQSGYVDDPRVQEMFTESQQRIQSMALIHETLYQSRSLERINMADYVRTLATHLVRSYLSPDSQVSLTINAAEVFLDVDAAIPCGLLLNELIANCLKHAFPDGRKGEVYVALSSDQAGRVSLVVRDDGVGFPAGVDFRSCGTLGLQLVTSLVEQLQGTITMERHSGCTFTITFTS
jgi:PAS domain S-box-containing protein